MSAQSRWGELSESITGFFFKKNRPATVAPPRLLSPQILGQGQFGFQVHLAEGLPYQVQASTDLKTWTGVASGQSSGAPSEFVDVETQKFGLRFYRAVADAKLVSPNVVGFVHRTFPPGFSMVSNPLNAADNRVGALFPIMPEGTTLNKFDTTLFRLTRNNYTLGKWANPGEVLVPGEGAIISNPTSDFRHLTFVGEIFQGDLTLAIQAGFSIRSSQVPLPGALESELGFPAADGDVIHLFDPDKQEYVVHAFNAGKWAPSPPVVAAAESFWVGKTSAGNWIQGKWVAKLSALS